MLLRREKGYSYLQSDACIGSCAAPTAPHASSTNAAPARHSAGPRNAVHCAALRTRATGQPAATSPSAADPATADAASAAIGGANDTCIASTSVTFELATDLDR